jgi:hypothetical protein
MKLPQFNLSQSVVNLEDAIITLSGPALAISGIIAGVDIVTNNAIASMFGELGIVWAICLLLSLDFQVLALGCRAHRLYHISGKSGVQKWAELALVFAIAAALAYVSLQMHSIFARVTGAGVSIEVAQAQLGINPIHLIWERSALVMVLIFMSGWLRGSHQTSARAETRVPDSGMVPAPVPAVPDLEELIERLDERYAQRMQTTIETITDTIIERTIERVTIAQLPQVAESREPWDPRPYVAGTEIVAGREPSDPGDGSGVGTEPGEREPLDLVDGSDVESRLVQAYKQLSTQGRVTVDALRLTAKCRKVTASEWLKRQIESERVA